MTTLNANLRKAAIFIRSLDADTAASLLGQLSPSEAKSVRMAIQSLGPIDHEERADVAAEFRRVGPLATEDPHRGVELSFSTAAERSMSAAPESRASSKPFEFLEQARVESLVPYLAREHAQTVAVVLSHLPPARAAELLAALPARLQAKAIERLSVLGETDPASLQVLEQELADWVARQQARRSRDVRRPDAATAILAAADERVRGEILANLLKQNDQLAQQIASALSEPKLPEQGNSRRQSPPPLNPSTNVESPHERAANASTEGVTRERSKSSPRRPISDVELAAPRPQIRVDDLARLDKATLATVLRTIDAELLVLALTGASEAVIARIAGQMPRQMAKAFRQRLHQLGPTRLRDVEAAQHEVATVAAQIVYARKSRLKTALS